MGVNNYENLRVWQDAIVLSKHIYNVTNSFPKSETFGLCSQMRRCAVSVASNIAEGAARNSRKEFRHFVSIALGSLAELDTQCVIARDIYLTEAACAEVRVAIEKLRRMLSGLKSKLKAAPNDEPLTMNH